jgi:hypothetical protein
VLLNITRLPLNVSEQLIGVATFGEGTGVNSRDAIQFPKGKSDRRQIDEFFGSCQEKNI